MDDDINKPSANPPRWTYRPLKYYGYVMRRIFGYGTMDELLCSLHSGMFKAESDEYEDGYEEKVKNENEEKVKNEKR